MVQVEIGFVILGQRQGTPGWADDPVWRHDGRQGREGRCMSG